MRPYLLLIAILILGFSKSSAQSSKVEVVSVSAVQNYSLTHHMDTFLVYYSNNRGGVAIANTDIEEQPLHYDSMLRTRYTGNYYWKVFKTYNSNGDVSTVKYVRDYDDSTIVKYNYSNNQIASVTEETWSAGTMQSIRRRSMTYNSSGLLTMEESERSSNGNQWTKVEKFEYQYLGILLNQILHSTWDNTNNTYVLYKKTESYYVTVFPDSIYNYTYKLTGTALDKIYLSYSNNKISALESHSTNDTSTHYYDKEKRTYQYDANGRLIVEELDSWDSSAKAWVHFSLTKNQYDNNSNIDTSIIQRWDGQQSQYFDYRKTFNYYTSNGGYRYSAYEDWDWNTSSLVPKEDTGFVYHYDTALYPKPTIINDINEYVRVAVYPNPATSFITVDISDIKEEQVKIAIYDMRGMLQRQIVVEENTNTIYIPVSSLPAGAYMLRASGESYQAVERFIISK